MMSESIRDGYKMTEMGEIPEVWDVVSLKSTAKYFIDGDWIELPYITNNGIRLIQTGNIGIGIFKNNEGKEKYVSSQTFENLKCHSVYPGDILICRLAEPIGRCCIVPNFEKEYITAVDNTIFRVNENIINREFIVQYINEPSTLSRITKKSGGSTRQRISRKNLENIYIPLPSLPEQHHIAEILSTIDETIERTEALIEKYRHIKAGLMSDLLTRGIDEEGRIRSEETHEFKDSPLGRIPGGWNVCFLENCCEKITDGSHFSPQPINDGPKILNVKDMAGRWINIKTCTSISYKDFEDLKKNGCSPKFNDVLLSKDGTIGKTLVYEQKEKIVLLSSIAIIRPINYLDSYFLNEFLQSFFFDIQLTKLTSGSALKRIVLKDIKKLSVIIPPLPEQHRITEILTAADTYIEKEQTYLNKLQQIKKGLMQDLLTGKVRVTTTLALPKPSEAIT
jgi:type I restriction enzyme S subunit